MKCKLVVLGLIAFIVLLVISCAPGEIPQAMQASKEGATEPGVSSLLPWEQEWQKLVKEAKKEGILNLYATWGPEERQTIIDAFRKDFDIKILPVIGKGHDIIEKIKTEHRSGLYIADILIGSPSGTFTLVKPAGLTIPIGPLLIHPDVTTPDRIKEVWYGGKLGWLDKEQHIITFTAYPSAPIAINTTMVKPEELSSYRDLLNPKWKGKIAWNDFTVGGTGTKHFMFMEEVLGRDFIDQLAMQNITLVLDQRLQVEWLARGKFPILLSPKTSVLNEARDVGAPVAWITPKEGTYLSVGGSTTSLIKKAPNLNASKLFINWIMTKEIQTIFSRVSGRQSTRTDVPYDHIPYPREPGKKYIVYDNEEFLPIQPKYEELGLKIFKP